MRLSASQLPTRAPISRLEVYVHTCILSQPYLALCPTHPQHRALSLAHLPSCHSPGVLCAPDKDTGYPIVARRPSIRALEHLLLLVRVLPVRLVQQLHPELGRGSVVWLELVTGLGGQEG